VWGRGNPYLWYRTLGGHQGLSTAIYIYPKYGVQELPNFGGGQE